MRNRLLILFVVLAIAGCAKEDPTVFSKPGKPVLVSPILNQICTTGTVVSDSVSSIPFIWQKVDGADSYELDVQNLLTDSIVTNITTATTFNVNLLPNTPYAWWVKARSRLTPIATPSEVWKFYSSGSGTISYAPFPAEIDAPLFGQVISGSTVILKWKGTSIDNNIVSYAVYFGTTNTPPLLQKGIVNEYTGDLPVQPGNTYYWHVVTTDANGNYTDSGMFQFSVTSL
jgi:hypothetical protein